MIEVVATSGLDVYAHNIETVKRLQKRVRDYRAGYKQSIDALESVKTYNSKLLTKTSLMLGLGEEDSEIEETLHDLRKANVDIVTFGQYLRPTRRHISVQAYVTPEKFDFWSQKAASLGFKYVASGPLVRSSYKAGELFIHKMITQQQSNNSSS